MQDNDTNDRDDLNRTDELPEDPHPAEATGDEPAAEGNGAEFVMVAKDKLEELQKKAAETDEYVDMLQRARAELSNYQKRARKEMDTIRESAIHDFATELLPVLDDFARALEALDSPQGEADPAAFADGVRMIESQLYKALEKHNIKPIQAKGRPFDPTYHEALMQLPTEEHEDGSVVEELRKGYTAGNRVLRAAQVVVATTPQQQDDV